jgi:hypothetical protein
VQDDAQYDLFAPRPTADDYDESAPAPAESKLWMPRTPNAATIEERWDSLEFGDAMCGCCRTQHLAWTPWAWMLRSPCDVDDRKGRARDEADGIAKVSTIDWKKWKKKSVEELMPPILEWFERTGYVVTFHQACVDILNVTGDTATNTPITTAFSTLLLQGRLVHNINDPYEDTRFWRSRVFLAQIHTARPRTLEELATLVPDDDEKPWDPAVRWSAPEDEEETDAA